MGGKHGARFSQGDRQREKRNKWANAGLCKTCGKEKDNDFLMCDVCLKKFRDYHKRKKLALEKILGGSK